MPHAVLAQGVVARGAEPRELVRLDDRSAEALPLVGDVAHGFLAESVLDLAEVLGERLLRVGREAVLRREVQEAVLEERRVHLVPVRAQRLHVVEVQAVHRRARSAPYNWGDCQLRRPRLRCAPNRACTRSDGQLRRP